MSFILDWVAPAVSASARADDTSKFYWYAPDSVVESGGVITSWDDKSANSYDLVQVGSLAKPTYASSSVVYTGSEVLGIAAHTYANSLRKVLRDGGSVAVFIVARTDATGQTPSTSRTYSQFYEGQALNLGENQQMGFTTRGNTFVTPTTVSASSANKRFGNAYSISAVSELSARNNALLLSRYVITQATAAWRLHPNTASGSVAVTPADFSDSSTGLYVGAAVSGTTLAGGFVGAIHEVYATTDVTTGNLDAITTELETVYGL